MLMLMRLVFLFMVIVLFVYDFKCLICNLVDLNSDEVFDVMNCVVLINMCWGMKKMNGGKVMQKMKLIYVGKGGRNCW